MDFLKRTFTKRYLFFFLLFFLVWYPTSFLLYIAFLVLENGFLFVALNAHFPLLISLFSFLYFRKSANDWNDRFFVAFGWVLLSLALAVILVKPIYGLDWTSILNTAQIQTNWIPVACILLVGVAQAAWKKHHV